jgi:hypothetical protein
MLVNRGMGDTGPFRPDPVGRLSGTQEERRVTRSWRLATGTLACPSCDVPVAPLPGPMAPADPIGCPYCRHAASVRDFLSLATPARAARVDVRVRLRTATAARRT